MRPLLLVAALLAAGCPDKAAPPPPRPPATSNQITPAKVRKQLEEAQQAHEKKMDEEIEKAR